MRQLHSVRAGEFREPDDGVTAPAVPRNRVRVSLRRIEESKPGGK